MGTTINGERVKQAREIRGLTQAELARLVGVNQSNIARVESGTLAASETLASTIALHTDFPRLFFEQDSGPEFPLGSLLFRKKSRLKSGERSLVRQVARLAFELYEKVSKNFQPYETTIPRLSESPELAAMITRSALGYSPDMPISDLVRRLERNGVTALAVPCPIKDHDAFSLWTDGDPRRPTVVLTAGKSGDRMRFSLAHELGHLVLHQAVMGSRSEVESEADIFASEFLMPAETIRRELKAPLTLTRLVELKQVWMVSVQALVMRARALDLISERQKKYLYQQISQRGWRTEEPARIESERPRLLRKMIETVYGSFFDYGRVASLISAPARIVEQLLDCYAGPPNSEREPKSSNLIVFRAR